MKNPMDRQLEQRLSDRAVAIGREGETSGFGELLELLRSSSDNARRLSVYPHDLPSLDALLISKLRLFGYTVSANERSEVSSTRSPIP